MGLLRNVTTGALIATRVERADGLLGRLVGLLGRPRIPPDEGLWLAKCSAIHTLGMRARLDLIFLDDEGRVLRLVPNVPPGRWAVVEWRARAVIELGAGALRKADVMPGDRIALLS